ncbi:MAG TPA: diacylglycerol kinase family protein [Acetobacteraceae bacterium]|nr:diacylglycerol kinase family protein [Acetobacteraceae bacterium]
MEREVTCILNCRAGSHEAARSQALIERVAAEHGRQCRVVLCHEGEDLAVLARQARAEGGLVVAGGGDGTVNAVAATLLDSQASLGVLPLGTLNHFAKDLHIPLDLESAVRTLFTGTSVRVDVGEVNGRIFLNNSSVGLYPQIVLEREQQQRRGHSKWVAFVHAVAHVMRRGVTLRITIEHDHERPRSLQTPFLFVGNNRYTATGLEIGTRARLDCGVLWLCAAPRANRVKLLLLALGALFGRISDADLTRRDLTRALIRTRRRRLHVATDGEVSVMRPPLQYRIRPGALRVVVPNPG